MSEEGGATPSDERRDISTPRVTPKACEGALGTWRFPETDPDTVLGRTISLSEKLDLDANQIREGCT